MSTKIYTFLVSHLDISGKDLNESNPELYINNIKYKYNKYFIPDKGGLFLINVIL